MALTCDDTEPTRGLEPRTTYLQEGEVVHNIHSRSNIVLGGVRKRPSRHDGAGP